MKLRESSTDRGQEEISSSSESQSEWHPGLRQDLHASPSAETEGFTLLQISVSSIKWTRAPTEGLKPPGNPMKLSLDDSIRHVATPHGRRTISLANLIGEDAEQHASEHNQTVSAPIEKTIWECLDWDPCEDLRTDWQVLTDLPEETRTWCEGASWMNLCDWEPQLSQHLEVYTDGSFRGQKAAWAFVVTSVGAGERDILGFLTAVVEAQAQVLIWATWWLLRFIRAVSWRGQVTFRWDSVIVSLLATKLMVFFPPMTLTDRSHAAFSLL